MEPTNTRPSNILIVTPFNLPEQETQEAYERAIFYLKEDMEFTDEEMDPINAKEYYEAIIEAVKEHIVDVDPETDINVEVAAIGTLITSMSGADIVYFTKGATDDQDLAMLRDFAIRHKIQVGEEHSEPVKPTHGRYPWGDRRYQNDDGTLTEAGKDKYFNTPKE